MKHVAALSSSKFDRLPWTEWQKISSTALMAQDVLGSEFELAWRRKKSVALSLAWMNLTTLHFWATGALKARQMAPAKFFKQVFLSILFFFFQGLIPAARGLQSLLSPCCTDFNALQGTQSMLPCMFCITYILYYAYLNAYPCQAKLLILISSLVCSLYPVLLCF